MKPTLLASLLLGAALAGPALAEPTPALSAASPATVSVKTMADHIEVSITSSAPLSMPKLRWADSAHKLELTLPGSTVAGPKRWQVDKGLLQRVEVPDAGPLTVDVMAISNPKWKWSMTPDKRSMVWSVSTSEISKGDPGPVKSGGEVVAKSSATVARPAPPVRTAAAPQPPRRPARVNPPSRPAPPLRPSPGIPPVSTTGPRPIQPQAVDAPTPLTAPNNNDVGSRKVSLSATNGDLVASLKSVAKAAGLEAQIDPSVSGKVTASFKDVPLNNAVTTMLGQQQTLYNYQITATALKVYGDSASGGQTLPEATLTGAPQASDYFPIKSPQSATKVLENIRKAVPGLTYTVDERLNVIVAEGDPAELDRLRKLLAKIAVK